MSGLCRSRPDDGPSKESHRQPKTSSGTGLRVGRVEAVKTCGFMEACRHLF